MGTTFVILFLQNAPSGIYKEIWEKKIKPYPDNLFPNAKAGITRVKNDPNFVYIEEVTYGRSLFPNDCNLTFSKDRFFKANFAFGVHKDFPYTQVFNKK